MYFLKNKSHVIIGSVSEDRKSEYFASLYCEVEPADDSDREYQFCDIALTRKQCEMLRDSLTHLLNFDT